MTTEYNFVFKPEHPTDTSIITRPKLYGDHLLKGYLTMLTGSGGTGKSVFSLTMACSLAIGRDLLNLGMLKQRRVLLLNNEDPKTEIERRILAIKENYRLSDNECSLLDDNLWFMSGYHDRLQIAAEMEGGVFPTALHDELIKFCTGNHIDALFIDPLVSIHDSSENDNVAMNAVIQILRRIAEDGSTGIFIAHHSKKGATAETPDDNARGASAITAGVRANYGLSKMTRKEAGHFVLADDVWPSMIRLDSGKRNYAPGAADATWFRLKNIPLEAIDWETGEPATEWVGIPAPETLQAKDKSTDGWNLEKVMTQILTAGITSPFKLTGESKETLQKVLSDTNKPLGKSALHERFSYFPTQDDDPRHVAAFHTVYKCWTEKGEHNAKFFHFEEKQS